MPDGVLFDIVDTNPCIWLMLERLIISMIALFSD